jgi:UrcA family protein
VVTDTTSLPRSENDQPDLKPGKPEARSATNADASPREFLCGAMLKELLMTVLRALILAAALLVPTTIAAAPAQRSVAVQTSDLDLATDKGQRVLALRIARAARVMCAAEAVSRLPRTMRSEQQCVRRAQASTAAAVAALTAAADPSSDRGG